MHPKIAELYHRHGYGFLTTADLPELVAVDRLSFALCVAEACRFIAPAQDVAHLVAIIDARGFRLHPRRVPVLCRGESRRAPS
jgi:hypothetical protein